MFDELEDMQNEVVVTYFKALCWHCSAGSNENQGQPQ
jgi:hypothetical protein